MAYTAISMDDFLEGFRQSDALSGTTFDAEYLGGREFAIHGDGKLGNGDVLKFMENPRYLCAVLNDVYDVNGELRCLAVFLRRSRAMPELVSEVVIKEIDGHRILTIV